MALTYYEYDNSPTEQYTEDGSFFAKRRLHCAWADRYDLIDLVAATGHTYPYNNYLQAPAISATIVPFNDNPSQGFYSDMMSYDTAVVTVTYGIASYLPNAISGNMVIEEMHPALEYCLIPKENMHVATADGDAPEDDIRVLVPLMDYSYTVFGLVGVSSNAYDLMGYVNQAPWITAFLGTTFPAETLRFIGPTPRVQWRLATTPKISIHMSFQFRPIEWSKQLTADGWQWIYRNDGEKLYIPGDFRYLTPSWLF